MFLSFTFVIVTVECRLLMHLFSKQVTDTDEAMASAVDIGESDVSCIPNLSIFLLAIN